MKMSGGLRDYLAGDTIRSTALGPGLHLSADGRRIEADRPIRVAVIGCGNHSRGALQPNLARLPHFDYVAACDLDETAAADCARRYGATSVHTDYERMLDEVRPEAVVVCGPPALHAAAGLAAVSRGIHLFVEKPCAPTIADAERLADAADAAGVQTLVGLFWRHTEAMTVARELIADPAFGVPLAFSGEYLAPGPRAVAWGWPSIGYSYLSDQAIHAIDGMRSLMGDVADLAVQRMDGPDGAAGYALAVRFASGASGSLALVAGTNAFTSRLAVHGSGGASVVVRDNASVEVLGRPSLPGARGGYVDENAITWGHGWTNHGHLRPGYLEELVAFAEAVRSGVPAGATVRDCVADLRVCEAILTAVGDRVP
jgi:myo-inositol 2-dehydrogenase/D-chiro-inositol 1-dehydrogenase